VDVLEALSAARAMCPVARTSIALDAQLTMPDAAVRAPNASHAHQWRFVLVDDRETITWRTSVR
jgi:nitroreductase